MESSNDTNCTFNESMKVIRWIAFIRPTTLIVLGTIGCTASLLILLVILKYPTLRKNDNSLHMIGFLAVADGSTCIAALIGNLNWFRFNLVQPTFTRAECLVVFTPLMYGQFLSQVMIIWIGIDRLGAISNPLKYRGKDHVKFAKQTFCSTVLLGVIHVGTMFINDLEEQLTEYHGTECMGQYWLAYYGLFTLTVSIVVPGIYIRMLIALKKKAKSCVVPPSAVEHKMAVQLKWQAEVNKTVGIIIGIFCALWVLPTILFFVVHITKVSRELYFHVPYFIAMGSVVSAASNLFIYAYKMPTYRIYLKKFLKGEKDNNVFTIPKRRTLPKTDNHLNLVHLSTL